MERNLSHIAAHRRNEPTQISRAGSAISVCAERSCDAETKSGTVGYVRLRGRPSHFIRRVENPPTVFGGSRAPVPSPSNDLEHLIWIRIRCGLFYAVEAEVRGLVATVALRRERIEGRGERSGIVLFGSLTKIREWGHDHAGNRVLRSDGRVFVRWMEPDDVVKALAELFDLVAGQLPIASLTCEPEFRVSHLLQAHELAESRHE